MEANLNETCGASQLVIMMYLLAVKDYIKLKRGGTIKDEQRAYPDKEELAYCEELLHGTKWMALVRQLQHMSDKNMDERLRQIAADCWSILQNKNDSSSRRREAREYKNLIITGKQALTMQKAYASIDNVGIDWVGNTIRRGV
jgi:hypothetical protein